MTARSVAVVLFTRDLRVHDNPTLHAALTSADQVLPLFVLDDRILGSAYNAPNRAHFLAGSLADLDASLKERGGLGLVVRRGDVAEETAAVAAEVGATEVHMSRDWSGYARRRQTRLEERLAEDGRSLRTSAATLAVVPPGAVVPSGGNEHFSVFTPYHRQWSRTGARDVIAAPRRISTPRVAKGPLPSAESICPGEPSGQLPEPGETAGRRRLTAWLRSSLERYADHHDDLPGDDTSRLSAYLHLGCLSPTEVVTRAAGSAAGDAFVRQVAWRDFHLQMLAAIPSVAHRDYRPRGDRWRSGGSDLQAWRDGRTGIPLVDAGMRQLLAEGWMHNRARLVVGSFLTKHLYVDWREGAAHFLAHLVDGDLANNQLNWQWVAGTGADSRPNRVLSPLRQAERFDPQGDYVRRYVRELSEVAGPAVHRPWELPQEERSRLDYPDPLVDLDEARKRFLETRG